MSRVVLFGTGRGADVAYRFLSRDTDHEIVAFAVDDAHRDRTEMRGLPVVAFDDVECRYPPDDFRMLILLGYQGLNRLRQQKFEAAKAKGYTLESYVASDVFRVEPLAVGENCFILDNTSISLDVRIGDNVVMWSSNHIGDLSVIEDHAWIASHVTVAAEVTVGTRAFVGIGATVSNGIHLGADSFVGAHTFVAGNTPAGSVHVFPQGLIANTDARAFLRVMMARRKL